MQPRTEHSSLPNAVVHPTLLHDEDLPVRRGASSASSTSSSKGQTRGANMSSSQHASAPEPRIQVGSAATNLNSGDCVRGADTSDVASGLNSRSVSGEATITSFSANANRQESPPYYYTSGGTRTKTNKSMNGFGENGMGQSMAGAASDDYDIDDNFDDHGNQVGVGMRKTKSILKNATPAKGAGGRKSGHGPSQLRCTPPSVLWRDEECSSRDLDSVQEVDSYKDINRRLFQGQQTGGGGCCTLM